MSNKTSRRLTAVAFAAALTLAGTAEAGPLSTGAAGSETSAWSLAWEWLADVWSDLTGVQSSTAADAFEADSLEDGGCEGCANSDAGWAIDPNGGGNGG